MIVLYMAYVLAYTMTRILVVSVAGRLAYITSKMIALYLTHIVAYIMTRFITPICLI
jgi:hypothetical protein